MKNSLILASLVFSLGCATASYAVTFDWAKIGNAGNAGDVQAARTFGAVAYNYAISKTEVTNAQYTEFLNAVAASDLYFLYHTGMGSSTAGGIVRSGSRGSYTYAVKADAAGAGPGRADYTCAEKPVVYVSWYDSARFTNWLHNGQGASRTPSGATETGAYTLLGGTSTPSNGLSITRNVNARYWLPSEDEWYKAAYHDTSAGTARTYFDYTTGTDTAPDNNLPSADSGNSANYYDGGYTRSPTYPLTDVGAYGLSESPYGTFDQSGNVSEWNGNLSRGLRRGSWNNHLHNLAASSRGDINPSREHSWVGFRVATLSVPEPTSLLLLVGIASGMLLPSRR